MEKTVYNATVLGKILLTPDLMVLRVHTDEPRDEFEAGQYTHIGALASEPRSDNSVEPVEKLPGNYLIKRPYSIASANKETRNFEFYISQVKSGQLTPRLFNLPQGAKMWVDEHILGVFQLNDVPENRNIVMAATGTGLAPYISFLRSHLTDRKNSKLVVFHGAAYPWDLGYYSELQFLDKSFDNFYYMPTLLKADETWNGLEGFIEKHLEKGILEENADVEVNPDKTHFFLCGNPKMVDSVTGFLNTKNYEKHSKDKPGALHVEEY